MWVETLIDLLVLTWVFTCVLVGGWRIGEWLAEKITYRFMDWKYGRHADEDHRDKGEQ